MMNKWNWSSSEQSDAKDAGHTALIANTDLMVAETNFDCKAGRSKLGSTSKALVVNCLPYKTSANFLQPQVCSNCHICC